jgi:hypothetical protein
MYFGLLSGSAVIGSNKSKVVGSGIGVFFPSSYS